ncbi:hypothetical protein PybrP1_013068 [[Pythium] brassicae (nom. inval.)]|nr:hypothetical protein PybrP1_013068 [[Pythium] brassicae (nom. inval.)]
MAPAPPVDLAGEQAISKQGRPSGDLANQTGFNEQSADERAQSKKRSPPVHDTQPCKLAAAQDRLTAGRAKPAGKGRHTAGRRRERPAAGRTRPTASEDATMEAPVAFDVTTVESPAVSDESATGQDRSPVGIKRRAAERAAVPHKHGVPVRDRAPQDQVTAGGSEPTAGSSSRSAATEPRRMTTRADVTGRSGVDLGQGVEQMAVGRVAHRLVT